MDLADVPPTEHIALQTANFWKTPYFGGYTAIPGSKFIFLGDCEFFQRSAVLIVLLRNPHRRQSHRPAVDRLKDLIREPALLVMPIAAPVVDTDPRIEQLPVNDFLDPYNQRVVLMAEAIRGRVQPVIVCAHLNNYVDRRYFRRF
jgi:hypothetical protein